MLPLLWILGLLLILGVLAWAVARAGAASDRRRDDAEDAALAARAEAARREHTAEDFSELRPGLEEPRLESAGPPAEPPPPRPGEDRDFPSAPRR